MSKRIFSEGQIKELLQNPNVSGCSEKSILYSKEFKVSAIKKKQEGLPSIEIFKQAGFDVDLIGQETPKDCIKRWRKVFADKGFEGLKTDGRKGNNPNGRPKTNWSNDKEKLKYLEAEVAYLKAENDFLAKLRKKSLN